MATIVGGSSGGAKIRVELDYSQSYNGDYTGVWTHVNGILASTYNFNDSTNDWFMNGALGSASGGAIAFNHGSGGGRTQFGAVANWTPPGGAAVGAQVNRIEAAGGNPTLTATIPCPVMAPYSDGNYYAYDVQPTSFWFWNFAVNPQGYTMIDAQAQINPYGQQDPGSWYVQAGAWTHFPATGLAKNTNYWWRMRFANNGWGWGPWGPWKLTTTTKSVPSAPYGYSARDITQTSFTTTGVNVADHGGGTLNNLATRHNTSPSTSGEITIIKGAWADITIDNLLPGTKYYFKCVACNEVGWSADGDWVLVTTLPGVLIKDQGTWKNAIPYVKEAGVWKQATRYVKDQGVWK